MTLIPRVALHRGENSCFCIVFPSHAICLPRVVRSFQRFCARLFSTGSRDLGVCRTLFSAGLEGLRALYTASLDMTSFAGSASAVEISELQYEAAWRQSIWAPLSTHRMERTLGEDGPNARLWRQLQRMEDKDFTSCENLLTSSQRAVWSELQCVEAENASRLNPVLAEAQMLREISELVDVAKAALAATAAGAPRDADGHVVKALDRLWNVWTLRLESGRVFFDSRGAILSCRAAVLGVLARQIDPAARVELHEHVSQLRVACLRDLGNHARQSGLDHNCTAAVRGLQSLGSEKPWNEYYHLERAKNLYVLLLCWLVLAHGCVATVGNGSESIA